MTSDLNKAPKKDGMSLIYWERNKISFDTHCMKRALIPYEGK